MTPPTAVVHPFSHDHALLTLATQLVDDPPSVSRSTGTFPTPEVDDEHSRIARVDVRREVVPAGANDRHIRMIVSHVRSIDIRSCETSKGDDHVRKGGRYGGLT